MRNTIFGVDVKVKRVSDSAILPTYGSHEAAGMDLYLDLESTPRDTFCGNPYLSSDETMQDVMIGPNGKLMLSAGIALDIPRGNVGLIYARSGKACKEDLRPSNCVGVVDSDYRGTVMVCIKNDSDEWRTIKNHERIAQMVITPYYKAFLTEVDELDSTDRGSGGFGSTGK